MPKPNETTKLRLDESETVWDILAGHVEAFIEAWDGENEPPDVGRFAPAGPATVRRLTLVELIKVDLEYRWSDGKKGWLVEQYMQQLPELSEAAGVSCDLLYEEYHIRRLAGDDVRIEEYVDRFPDQADRLRRLMGSDALEMTTSLVAGRRPRDVEVGDEIDDFELLTRLGKGAFASVFLARQKSMQRLVALKVSADRGNEPQTLAQLDHPHIVRVFDQRVLPERDLRLLYMQYVPGGTLQDAVDVVKGTLPGERNGALLLRAVDQVLEKRGESPPLDSTIRRMLQKASWPEVVCWLGVQLAGALDYAHGRGVLHRDLKPANILMTAEGAMKLVDFNISFCAELEGAAPAAYFGGSLGYMSPEQLEACNPDHPSSAERLDRRSDLYSLGVVLWELLSGSRPFPEETLEGSWAATLDEMSRRRRSGVSPDAKRRLRSACPAEIADVLLRCLEPEMESRFDSGGELAGQLRLCLTPSAGKLLRPAAAGYAARLRRYGVTAVLLMAIVPNLIAAGFNLAYNRQQIVERLADSQDVFWNVQTTINAIGFPLGMALLVLLVRPVAIAARRQRDEPIDPQRLAVLRDRSLRLGHWTAVVGIAEWSIAGLAYPVAMHAAGVSLSAGDYLHFMASLVLCGLIAAIYPFFGVTVIALRAFYPALVGSGGSVADDVPSLSQLYRRTWYYLALAASLPMLGVMLMVAAGADQNRTALVVLCAAGLAGFGLVFRFARIVQRDIAILVDSVASHHDSFSMSTESFRASL